jgi:SAM-dependent methyltransferase
MHPQIPPEQHNIEILKNKAAWENKQLLQNIYQGFYRKIATCLRTDLPGSIVELGSGMGNIKSVVPRCITTDLFPNPWLDRQENAYALTFADRSIANLILFDVWHHLAHPQTALQEFARVVAPGGRLILFEPGMSWLGRIIYGLFHHEYVGWDHQFAHQAPEGFVPENAPYFAAQASATRFFLRDEFQYYHADWRLVQALPVSSLAYAASGGFSKLQYYPTPWLPAVQRLDQLLLKAPNLFATRLLIVLERKGPANP